MTQLLITTAMVMGYVAVRANDKNPSVQEKAGKVLSAEVPVKWSNMTLRILKDTKGGSPTYGSRSLGYLE